MSYIWEDYSVDNKYILAISRYTPYFEVCRVSGKTKYVNGYFRFSSLFLKLIEKQGAYTELLKAAKNNDQSAVNNQEINFLFHLLANMDRLSGISKLDVELFLIENAITQGYYGEYVKEEYVCLGDRQQYLLLSYMKKAMDSRHRDNYFVDVLSDIFAFGYKNNKTLTYKDSRCFNSRFYYSDLKDKLIVYIPFKSDSKDLPGAKLCNERVYNLIKFLFLDLNIEDVVFWRYHFGIVDKKETMKIGSIALY